jgi:hypothetical protein
MVSMTSASPDNEAIRQTRDYAKVLAESSLRLEKATRRLNQLTAILIATAVVSALIVIFRL